MVGRNINPALQLNSSDGSDSFKSKAKHEMNHGKSSETRGRGRQVEEELRDPIWETTARQVEDNWKTIATPHLGGKGETRERQLENYIWETLGRQLGRPHLGDNWETSGRPRQLRDHIRERTGRQVEDNWEGKKIVIKTISRPRDKWKTS